MYYCTLKAPNRCADASRFLSQSQGSGNGFEQSLDVFSSGSAAEKFSEMDCSSDSASSA